jgi:Lipoprotein LpqB beta-propeller domain/Sporulation and spore germination
MSRLRRRAVPRALGLLLVGAVLSACAVIPSSGPVVPGRVVNEDPRDGVVQVISDDPQPGATAAGIVNGFLLAAADFRDDHRVARNYLTPQRRLTWRPDASVSVYPSESSLKVRTVTDPAPSSSPSPSASLPSAGVSTAPANQAQGHASARPITTKITVSTPVEARIDVDGRYRLAPPGDQVSRTFTLVKTGGEWRIDALSDGILIADNDFAVTFRPFKVYFTDPTGRYLVPDLHWFAGTRDQPGSAKLPTALVRVLLEGPPPWLRGAVVSGAPDQTRMAVAAVVVSGDVATVDLTDPVRAADTRQRQLLISQLEATLGQLSTIGAVQITVRRLAFDVPSGSSESADPSQPPAQPVADPRVDGRPVVIDGKGRLARLDDGTLQLVKDVAGLSAVPGANRPAVSSDSSAYAVLSADRSKLLVQLPGTKVVILVKAAELTAPSFDPLGWVWTAPGANTGWVYASGLDSGKVKVQAPWMKNFQVVSLRISRDGTRAAIAVRYRGVAHLFLSGVIRDAQGRPQSLTQPIGLVPDLRTVTDVAWVDEDHVVVLGKREAIPGERPWVVQIGGSIESSTAVPDADSIAAGNGDLTLIAGTPKGVEMRSGALWYRVSSARWPAFPG